MKTLEQFIENQCGMITPNLLALLEPHRQCVETALSTFNKDEHSWEDFVTTLWTFLPEPKENDYKK